MGATSPSPAFAGSAAPSIAPAPDAALEDCSALAPVLSVSPHEPHVGPRAETLMESDMTGAPEDGETARDDSSGNALTPASRPDNQRPNSAGAASAAARLEMLLHESEQQRDEAAGASLHLQERIRLAAQMLEAFEVQIGRVEAALRELHQRELTIEQAESERLQAWEKRADGIVARCAQRIELAAEAVAKKFGQDVAAAVATSSKHVTSMHDIGEVIADARLRLAADIAKLSRTFGTAASALERNAQGGCDSGLDGGDSVVEPREAPPPLRLRACADEA